MSAHEEVVRLPETGFVRLSAILGGEGRVGVFPISKTSWYEGIKAGRYPKPVKHGRCSLWRVADVRALLTHLESSSNGQPS